MKKVTILTVVLLFISINVCYAEGIEDVSIVQNNLDTIWVLLAAFLVFFMQPGFAMVESGFTRAKNTSNIIIKNVMDFSIASIAFFIIGYGFMFGSDAGGFIGISGFFNPLSIDMGLTVPNEAFIIFQTVFAGTAATIVSGAMAERTKFSSYLIFSTVLTLIIYPVVGHWVWGGGWLSNLGFVDFAGSTVVHSVGGWAALMGAAILGPRIGKYRKDGKSNAIPGHNITLGALGVFILWFGWFGFNPGSELAADSVTASIAMTTNLAAAASALVVMFVTWARYGKPDVSMTLNGVLGGLVAITAGCAAVEMYGAMVIGVVAGFTTVFGIEFIDKILKVDDPVGAIGVHGFCGVVGTIMVGLFATEGGLLYGGGSALLCIQTLGVVTVAAWTLFTSFILFKTIKSTVGLRVSKHAEEKGLDLGEHSIEAYADFMLKI